MSEGNGEPEQPVDPDDTPVPRIGRGRGRRRGLGVYLPPAQLVAIFGLLIGLFAVISMKESCAQGVGNMFRTFDVSPDAGVAMPRAPRLAPPAP